MKGHCKVKHSATNYKAGDRQTERAKRKKNKKKYYKCDNLKRLQKRRPGRSLSLWGLVLRVLKLGLPTGGRGAALRVRQIGRKLHTAYINPSKNGFPGGQKRAQNRGSKKTPKRGPILVSDVPTCRSGTKGTRIGQRP